MKNHFIQLAILVLVIFTLKNVLQSQQWVRQYPFPVMEELVALKMLDNGVGWAVGANNIILKTENFGNLWEPIYTDMDSESYNAIFIDCNEIAY